MQGEGGALIAEHHVKRNECKNEQVKLLFFTLKNREIGQCHYTVIIWRYFSHGATFRLVYLKIVRIVEKRPRSESSGADISK
ncbi:hypothetical protein A8V49_09205 [Yersinia pestis]|nr:hypothetical protein A8V49_09205 [Yersinia pestis]